MFQRSAFVVCAKPKMHQTQEKPSLTTIHILRLTLCSFFPSLPYVVADKWINLTPKGTARERYPSNCKVGLVEERLQGWSRGPRLDPGTAQAEGWSVRGLRVCACSGERAAQHLTLQSTATCRADYSEFGLLPLSGQSTLCLPAFLRLSLTATND